MVDVASICQGEGQVHIEMQFMADISLTCEACHGKRFKEEILDVAGGKDVAEILDMTVDDGIAFFQEQAKTSNPCQRVVNKLLPLQETGLGYVKLGQQQHPLRR